MDPAQTGHPHLTGVVLLGREREEGKKGEAGADRPGGAEEEGESPGKMK